MRQPAAVATVAVPACFSSSGSDEVQQTHFDVFLSEVPADRRVSVIRSLRDPAVWREREVGRPPPTLQEATWMVSSVDVNAVLEETPGTLIASSVQLADAQDLKKDLERAGAVIVLR